MTFGAAGSDPFGYPIVSIEESTSDQPIASGVAPFSIRASTGSLHLRPGGAAQLSWVVSSARGARLDLANPLNRVQLTSSDPSVAAIRSGPPGATIRGRRRGRTMITLTYQRELASGSYRSVDNITGLNRRLVATTVNVTVGG
jgi:hypothetical protein